MHLIWMKGQMCTNLTFCSMLQAPNLIHFSYNVVMVVQNFKSSLVECCMGGEKKLRANKTNLLPIYIHPNTNYFRPFGNYRTLSRLNKFRSLSVFTAQIISINSIQVFCSQKLSILNWTEKKKILIKQILKKIRK